MVFRRILVPLDGSKRAERILPHIEDLARRYQKSQVILLQVVEPVPATIYLAEPLPPVMDPNVIDQVYKNARRYLERLQARLRKKGIQAHVHVSLGPVAATIVDLAAREKIDLIALASHGRSGLPAFFYGSVAAGVLHRTDRPLLIVRSIQPQS
jgi:nucleotide-binding universal stress UspA family protein